MKRVGRKEGVFMFIDFQVPLPRNPLAYLILTVEFGAERDNHIGQLCCYSNARCQKY